ncbi:MAG: hypothetical protein CMG55_07000 [Candidatus Marinimicrobia bacterium]|nr:hypothetical protein [Candidatus Neomarinimicrobiota bacterium]
MIKQFLINFRIFTLVGILFFFMNCLGKTKPFKFNDIQSLDVRILDTKEWRLKVKKEMKDLNKIMRPQLKYYLKKDFRIYEKLDSPYESIKLSVSNIDSLYKDIYSLVRRMKKTGSDSLDDVPKDTTVSYRFLIQSKRESIKDQQGDYYKNIKKLKKAFKSTKQILMYIEDECKPLKQSIYELQYRRKLEKENIDRFNEKLNHALFIEPGSLYSNRIIEVSKTFESYRVKLESFEKFLLNIESIASKELGGTVVLIPKKQMPPQFVKRYKNGKKEYMEILKEIRKVSESI